MINMRQGHMLIYSSFGIRICLAIFAQLYCVFILLKNRWQIENENAVTEKHRLHKMNINWKIRLLTCQNESIINFNGMVYIQFEREKRSTIKNHEQRLGVYDVDIYGTHIFV